MFASWRLVYPELSTVMAGLVPAIHDLLAEVRRGCPAQASLRSLRKLGCERGHDENE
jgi:hypothetical protein